MGENSEIQWTDHTFNPWIGCTKVSPGCDHCYAESYADRFGKAVWGPGKPRQLTSDSNWRQPLKWNAQAEKAGVRYRVFCASLADVFDNEVSQAWRTRLWNLVAETPHLDWLLLTKRIGNAKDMLPPDWSDGWPNVWIGATIVNQMEADRDIPKLLAVPARVRFLSMEPLLGPVDLEYPGSIFPEGPRRCCSGHECGCMGRPVDPPLIYGLDWVIVGGESGNGASPLHPDWARSLRDQCEAAGVAFHFKQWGEWAPFVDSVNRYGGYTDNKSYNRSLKRMIGALGGTKLVDDRPEGWPSYMIEQGTGINGGGPHLFMVNVGKKAAGRMLDGREWNELPREAA